MLKLLVPAFLLYAAYGLAVDFNGTADHTDTNLDHLNHVRSTGGSYPVYKPAQKYAKYYYISSAKGSLPYFIALEFTPDGNYLQRCIITFYEDKPEYHSTVCFDKWKNHGVTASP